MSDSKKVPSKRAANWAKSVLRRASVKWWGAGQALKDAFVRKEGRKYVYQCAHCLGEFYRTEINRDHIEPVVPVDKSKDELTMDEYCATLLPGPLGYQILCIKCHDKKSEKENALRRKNGKLSSTKKAKTTKRKTKKKSKSTKRKKSRLGNRD